VFTAGGTDYYNEPGIPGTPYGAVELEGTRTTRMFNPASGRWTRLADMGYGRWYPSLVTLPSGDIFVASGVTKLVAPVYPQQPQNSFTNVKQTETYSLASGTWSYNGSAADYSLPLYPRLHLLPDGKVYYDAGGQVFNPFGQSVDEALWNQAAVYDPAAKSWAALGIPGFPGTAAGFRGSTFSIGLPLSPPYSKAKFLTAGGIIGTTPGTYLATRDSRITTIDTSSGDRMSSSIVTGPLNNARWYSTGVLLPDGTVFAVSPSTRLRSSTPLRISGLPSRRSVTTGPITTAPCCFQPARSWSAVTHRSTRAMGHRPPCLVATRTITATPPLRSTTRPTCSSAGSGRSSRR